MLKNSLKIKWKCCVSVVFLCFVTLVSGLKIVQNSESHPEALDQRLECVCPLCVSASSHLQIYPPLVFTCTSNARSSYPPPPPADTFCFTVRILLASFSNLIKIGTRAHAPTIFLRPLKHVRVPGSCARGRYHR